MFLNQISTVLNAIVVAHRDNKVNYRFATNIIGEAGIGKSQLMKEVATNNDMALVNVRVGQLEPGDLIGIPREETINGITIMKYSLPGYLPHYKRDENGKVVIRPDGSKMLDIERLGSMVQNRYELIEKLGSLDHVKGCLLFFDEINRVAGDDTKQAIFQLPEQYRIHTYSIPQHCCLVSASNPNTEDYQVNEMDSERAFMDRFLHLKAEARLEDWMSWAERRGIDPNIISFVNNDKSALFSEEKFYDLDIKPSPRSAELLHTLLTEVQLPQEDAILREVFSGVLGSSHAQAFVNHLRENIDRVVTGEEIFTDYKKVRKTIQRAVAENRTDYIDQVLRSAYVLLAEPENIEKYDVLAKLNNYELFLQDLPSEIRMTHVQQVILFDHANDVLGTSDVVYNILQEDANAAHASN